MSGNFLTLMANESRRRVAASRELVCAEMLLDQASVMAPAPRLNLHARFDLIAELKLRSPATGITTTDRVDIGARVAAYGEAGAAAVSVLTEPSRFGGTLADLAVGAEELQRRGVPVIRKDFLVDPYQLVETRIAGAGGALVILRMLSRAELESLIVFAHCLDLFLLLEAFDEADLRLATQLVETFGPEDLLVGVNSRDLASLQVQPDRLLTLADYLPEAVPCVAESGLATPEDMREVAGAGYRLALVGGALMQSPDPGALVREFIDAGRSA